MSTYFLRPKKAVSAHRNFAAMVPSELKEPYPIGQLGMMIYMN